LIGGGNDWFLNEYLKRYPRSIVSPKSPISGRIIVSVNDLIGLHSPQQYQWLREHFKPIDQIAYSYLVFNVYPKDLENLNGQ